MEPDLAGFAAAQEQLRSKLGLGIVLLGPVDAEYDPSVALDSHGRPLDPMAVPVASGRASAAVKGTVSFRAINRAGVGGDAVDTVAGLGERTHVMVSLSPDDEAETEGMTHLRVRDDLFQITSVKDDEPVPGARRILVYGEREGPAE